MIGVSFKRLRSLLRKEFIQVRRDPLTLRLIIAMPIMQPCCSAMRSIPIPSTCRPGFVRGAVEV